MRWKKLGRLFSPCSNHAKLISHAANPLPLKIKGDQYRIFYSGRDRQNRSSVGYVDLDILTRKIIHVSGQPAVVHGAPGSFYSDGISIGGAYKVKNQTYVLFMAWQAPAGQHWQGAIGRLHLSPDLKLSIQEKTPFLSMNEADPLSLSYPFVMNVSENVYYMWYGSTKSWDCGNGEMLHVLNYAQSSDGIAWERKGLAIPFKIGTAQAFSRPSVLGNDSEGYHMWFSYRGDSRSTYRIGYAFSKNLESWELKLDAAGIDVSKEGWDSEMIEYPYVFDHRGERYMMYNGNGYGKTGFGMAVLEQG